MVKLVDVYQGGSKSGTRECKARRYMPLEIEPDVTMVMALDEFCLACGSGSQANNKMKSKCKLSDEVEIFKRNLASVDKDELSEVLGVTWDDVVPVLTDTVNCVGCRRSIETLYLRIKESSKDWSLDPLVINKDGTITLSKEHINNPTSLSNLLCTQIDRLDRRYISGPNGKKPLVKKGGRCAHHMIDQKKIPASGSWLDCWDVMETECKDEVVLLPFSSIRAALDKYLKRYRFCPECAYMVNKAYRYYIENGKDPLKVDEYGEDISEDATEDDVKKVICRVSDDPSLNLFSGISSCVEDGHVHITRSPGFISKLLLLAEPDNSGLDKERHAKNMAAAQKELLIVISITLSRRFQKIQQRLREGEQTCDLLSLVALIALRKSFDICMEKQRSNIDLDELCFQIEQIDRDREEKQARKREKKSTKKQQKKEIKAALKEEKTEDTTKSCDQEKDCKEMKNDPATSDVRDAPVISKKKKSKCKKKGDKGLRKNSHDERSFDSRSAGHHYQNIPQNNNGDDSDSGLDSGNGSPIYARSEGTYSQGAWMKGGSPDLGLEEWEFAKHNCTASKQGTICNMVVPGVEQFLESESSDDDDPILLSQEEIKEFLSMFPQLNSQRQQLRKNLRERFEAFCVTCNDVGADVCWKHEPRGY